MSPDVLHKYQWNLKPHISVETIELYGKHQCSPSSKSFGSDQEMLNIGPWLISHWTAESFFFTAVITHNS